MNRTCECGMTLERAARGLDCRDCGTPICASCAVQMDANTYCRWCATSLGMARAA